MKDKVKIRLAIEKVCKSKKKQNGRPTKKYRQAQKILANIDRYTDLIHTIVCETEEKEQAIKSGAYRDGDFPNAFVPHISGSSAPWKSRKAFRPTHSAALAAAAYSNDSKSICALSISPV